MKWKFKFYFTGLWSIGASGILWIAHGFSNAKNFSVGLKVSMRVTEHTQLHIVVLIFRDLSTLFLLLFSTVVVQVHGKFLLLVLIIMIFCYHRLSCLVYQPTSYLRLKFDGRKRVVQIFFHYDIYSSCVEIGDLIEVGISYYYYIFWEYKKC